MSRKDFLQLMSVREFKAQVDAGGDQQNELHWQALN